MWTTITGRRTDDGKAERGLVALFQLESQSNSVPILVQVVWVGASTEGANKSYGFGMLDSRASFSASC